MPVNLFNRSKKLQQELQEKNNLLLQKQREEEAHRRREWQLQDEIRLRDQQIELEAKQREIEARQRDKEKLERERLKSERLQRGAEQKQREQDRLMKLRQTTPEALRRLRDLIRTRYELDMYIWSLKGARRPDRPLVEENMAKADAVLMEIYTRVGGWEENDNVWTRQEWELAQEVKQRILGEGKRWWENNPPWNEN